MSRPTIGLSLFFLFAALLACDVSTLPGLTSNPVATGVAGTLTAQAQQATAVASTVAARVLPAAIPSTPTIAATMPLLSPPVSTAPSPTSPDVLTVPAVYYNLVLRYSKNCLGVQSTTQGSIAVEATCNPSSRLWSLLPMPSGGDYFQLQVQNSGNCLSASSRNVTDPFVLKSCQGSDDQLWQKKFSGGYFQLVNKALLANEQTNMCVDARQWNQPIMQWPCKPWQEDDQLDNQLLCQTTTNTAACAPPPGVYVTSIQQDPPPYSDADKPNTFHVFFKVTFNNSTGAAQSYTWFIRTFGQNGGQTPQQMLAIPPGVTTISVGPWNIGRTCTNFTAKAQWIRPTDGLLFTFRDPDGNEYALPFQVCRP